MMKLDTILTFTLVAALLLGCSKSEMSRGVGEEMTVSYTVTAPATKASLGNGDAVNHVWYALYRKSDNSLVKEFPMQPFTAGKAICPVTMVRDQSYKVVFVAQHYEMDGAVKTPAYAVDPAKAVLAMPVSAVANSDNYDVFCFVDEVDKYQGGIQAKGVTLTRKVAQLNYICTAEDAAAAATLGMTPSFSRIVLSGVPASYSILLDRPSDNTVSVDYAKAALTGDPGLLGTAFFFAGDNLTTTQLQLYRGPDGAELTTTLDVGNVPVEMNKRTNITGAFMTGTVDYEIAINTEDIDISHPLN